MKFKPCTSYNWECVYFHDGYCTLREPENECKCKDKEEENESNSGSND